MDDQPIWFSTRKAGRILAVPYPQELNDIPAIVARKDSASQFADMIVENFDEMLAQAQSGPLVMGIALHPYIVGQPYRCHLRRALNHVATARERVWITRCVPSWTTVGPCPMEQFPKLREPPAKR